MYERVSMRVFLFLTISKLLINDKVKWRYGCSAAQPSDARDFSRYFETMYSRGSRITAWTGRRTACFYHWKKLKASIVKRVTTQYDEEIETEGIAVIGWPYG